jgi:predicted 3-demethylubiquinone-9 3-methyltransferase (glyoxalase superfamily)
MTVEKIRFVVDHRPVVRPQAARNFQGTPPCPKSPPACGSTAEAEEAARFYVSLLPDSRIDRVQNNLVDGPAGKAGSVLVVQFTLAGQEYMALNGGMRFEHSHAISFKIDCADQAEVDRLWTRCPPMADRSSNAAG